MTKRGTPKTGVGNRLATSFLRPADTAIKHWALRLPPSIGWIASIALVAALLGIALFRTYISIETRTASQNAQSAVRLSDAYQDARLAISEEEGLALEYRLTPSDTVRAEFEASGQRFMVALNRVQAIGGPSDARFVREVGASRVTYLDATRAMFAAVDAGDRARSQAIATQEIAPALIRIEHQINAETTRHNDASVAALQAQDALNNLTARKTPIVLGAGIVLVAFLALVMEVNRRARDSKSLFLARVSHELRTPLNAILGFSQLLVLLEGANLNDRQRRYIDNITSSGNHLLALIDDVLDMSKVEAGKLAVNLTPIAVDDAISAALGEVAPLIGAKGLQVQPLQGTRGLTVAADPLRLRQVLLNGLSNAIKFTEPGGSLSFASRSSKREAWIELTDTGAGIPAAQMARMFGEFEQLNTSRTRTGEGTGLGLPLSSALVKLMGGTLRLSSQEGRGTTFSVRLALAEQASEPVQNTANTAPAREPVG